MKHTKKIRRRARASSGISIGARNCRRDEKKKKMRADFHRVFANFQSVYESLMSTRPWELPKFFALYFLWIIHELLQFEIDDIFYL